MPYPKNRRSRNSPIIHGIPSGYQAGCRCDECRAAHAKRRRDWMQKTPERQHFYRRANRDWIDEQKAGRPCADCGGAFPPYVMDFDHRPDEEKAFTIANSASKSRDALLVEMAKCDLVCANCHRVRTVSRLREVRQAVN